MSRKVCKHCGKKFKAKSNNQLFCSKECRYAKIKCAECGKEHPRNNKNPNGEYICMSCYNEKYRPKAPLVKCAECGKEHPRNNKNPNGEYICKSCYDEKYRPKAPLVRCVECGKEHPRNYKNSKGDYICSSCEKKGRPIVKCSECGKEERRNHKNEKGKYVCDCCYIIEKCQKIINKNNKYNLEDEDEVLLFIAEAKKKYSFQRLHRQLECELLGYGNYNEAMNQAMKRDNYTCQITGKKGNVVVHHLNSYNTHKELACDLDNLITIDKDFHDLYHNTCGRGNNTAEQFWKFVEEWEKGIVTLDDFKEEQ